MDVVYRQPMMASTQFILQTASVCPPATAVPQLHWTFSVVSTFRESICQVGGGLPAAH